MVQMAGLRLCNPYRSEPHILKICLPVYSLIMKIVSRKGWRKKENPLIVDELQNKECHNANSITYTSMAVVPLRMLQYDSLMEYYFREPEHIYIRNRNGGTISLEQIFRVIRYETNQSVKFWTIYGDEREAKKLDRIILRKGIWNIKEQISQLQQTKELGLPQVKLSLHVCDHHDRGKIIQKLTNADRKICAGIQLVKPDDFNLCSHEEFHRKLNWGAVTVIYNKQKKLKGTKAIHQVTDWIDQIIQESLYLSDEDLVLDYTFPMEQYINNVLHS